MDLKRGPLFSKRLKNEMRRIRQRIDAEKNRAKKAKKIEACACALLFNTTFETTLLFLAVAVSISGL